MKLIDKAAIVAEIERLEADAICQYKSDKSRYAEGSLDAIHQIKHLLNTFDVKEVDLEKEINNAGMAMTNHQPSWKEVECFAKHFFDLGLKSQKGE